MNYRDLAYHQLRELRASLTGHEPNWELVGDLSVTLKQAGEQDELAELMLEAYNNRIGEFLNTLLHPVPWETWVPMHEIFDGLPGWRIEQHSSSSMTAHQFTRWVSVARPIAPVELAPGLIFGLGGFDQLEERIELQIGGGGRNDGTEVLLDY